MNIFLAHEDRNEQFQFFSVWKESDNYLLSSDNMLRDSKEQAGSYLTGVLHVHLNVHIPYIEIFFLLIKSRLSQQNKKHSKGKQTPLTSQAIVLEKNQTKGVQERFGYKKVKHDNYVTGWGN